VSDDRYARQSILPQVGRDGQTRLAAAHAVIVGCGALGTYQAQILARAGVGRLTIVDRDFVERSNLQRQILFTDEDAEAGLPKAVAAERALTAINPAIEVRGVVDDLHAGNAEALLVGADVVCDGTDNFETRYLVNDWAVRESVPWVYGGVIGTSGLVLPILPHETPCLRCVFETPPEPGAVATCETAGVLGSAVALVAGLQATEMIKLLLGAREAVTRAMLVVEAWEASWRRVGVGLPRPECPACGVGDYAYLEGRRGSRAARLCGRDAIQLLPREASAPSLEAIAARLGPEWRITRNEYLLRARRDGVTIHLFQDGRAIIEGITDETEARSLYARVVGM
jgi:molybdopterin/thiamine biosynthesis adenylyltransferase